jgi:hypothetical protein
MMLRFVSEQLHCITHSDSRDLKGRERYVVVSPRKPLAPTLARKAVRMSVLVPSISLCREILAHLSEGENLSQEP